MDYNDQIKIVERSLIARVAATKLKSKAAAIVIGKKIFLYGVAKQDFLANESWLNHELCHINQYKKYGLLRFIFLYLLESIKHGYYNNKFEIEARAAETKK